MSITNAPKVTGPGAPPTGSPTRQRPRATHLTHLRRRSRRADPHVPRSDDSMKCYVCAVDGTESPAVGICGVCSVGLCVEHIAENARRRGPGGAHAADCLHRLGYDEGLPRVARLLPIGIGNTRAPAA